MLEMLAAWAASSDAASSVNVGCLRDLNKFVALQGNAPAALLVPDASVVADIVPALAHLFFAPYAAALAVLALLPPEPVAGPAALLHHPSQVWPQCQLLLHCPCFPDVALIHLGLPSGSIVARPEVVSHEDAPEMTQAS